MSVYNQTYEQSSMHKKSWLQARVLMLGYYCTKVISFLASKIWFQARVLMSVYNQTYEQSSYIKDLASSQGYGVRLLYDSNKSSLSQRSGFKPGF